MNFKVHFTGELFMLVSPNSILGNTSVVSHLEGHVRFHKADALRVVVGTQLSGPPHFGTVMTQRISSLICQMIQEQFSISTSLHIDFLDNTTMYEEEHQGAIYQRNLWQGEESSRIVQNLYGQLLDTYRLTSEVSFSLFSDLTDDFRQKAIQVIDTQDAVIPFLGKPTVRIPCPHCGLMDKKGVHTHYMGNGIVKGYCPHHGEYQASLLESVFDVNVLWRNLIKEMILDPQDIIIKGTDWLPGCQKVDFAHRVMGSTPPTRLFLPLVVMGCGAKLSKSFLRQNPDLSGEIPSWLKESHTLSQEVIDFVSTFGRLVLSDARHFYRSYTIGEIERLYQLFLLS
jgi:hypothetical protein